MSTNSQERRPGAAGSPLAGRWRWLLHPGWRAVSVGLGAFAGLVSLAAGGWQVFHPAAPAPWHWGTALALTLLVAALARGSPYALPVLLVWWPLWPPGGLIVLAAAGLLVGRARVPRSGRGVVLGSTVWGRALWLGEADRLMHLHVLGPTGSGKSTTVLAPLMRQDAVAGVPFTLIEPKGDLADAVRRQLLQARRAVIPFNPTDAAAPHLNPLAGPPAAAAEGLALALDQLEPGTPSFYRTVSRVLLVQAVQAVTTALGADADLPAVLRFLRSDGFRTEVLSQHQDPEVAAYFRQEWGGVGRGRQQEWQMGLVNRLRSFLLHPGLRRALTPPYDFTIDDVWQGQSLVAALPLGELGLGARATGALLWHLLVQSAFRHGPQRRLCHALYLDEFHQYVAPDLSDVLAMVRGYGLAVVLAHQDMGQLTPTLQQAVEANARTRILLAGTAAEDIARFSRAAAPHPLASPRYAVRGRATVLLTRRGRLLRPAAARLPAPRAAAPLPLWTP